MALGPSPGARLIFDAIQLANLPDEPDRFPHRLLERLVEAPSGMRQAPDALQPQIFFRQRLVDFIGIGLHGALKTSEFLPRYFLATTARKLQNHIFLGHRVEPQITSRRLAGYL